MRNRPTRPNPLGPSIFLLFKSSFSVVLWFWNLISKSRNRNQSKHSQQVDEPQRSSKSLKLKSHPVNLSFLPPGECSSSQPSADTSFTHLFLKRNLTFFILMVTAGALIKFKVCLSLDAWCLSVSPCGQVMLNTSTKDPLHSAFTWSTQHNCRICENVLGHQKHTNDLPVHNCSNLVKPVCKVSLSHASSS